jgi:hypothetical protein
MDSTGSSLNSVMNDVPSAPIGDFENEQWDSTLFKCRDRFPNGPLHRSIRGMDPTLEGPMPAWSPSHGFLHHTIGTLNNTMCIHAIMVLGMLTIQCGRLLLGVRYGIKSSLT